MRIGIAEGGCIRRIRFEIRSSGKIYAILNRSPFLSPFCIVSFLPSCLLLHDILEIRFPPPIEIPSRLSPETNLSSSLLLDLKDLCIRRVHRRIAYPKFK